MHLFEQYRAAVRLISVWMSAFHNEQRRLYSQVDETLLLNVNRKHDIFPVGHTPLS